MKFNNSTVILIVILLLILYLLDNIKELEDNILEKIPDKNKNENFKPRHKYFQDIYYNNLYDNKEKLKNNKNNDNNDNSDNSESILKELNINKNNDTININISLEEYKPPIEERVIIPSMDKHISGVSGPGITTMSVKSDENKEKPVFLNY